MKFHFGHDYITQDGNQKQLQSVNKDVIFFKSKLWVITERDWQPSATELTIKNKKMIRSNEEFTNIGKMQNKNKEENS